MKVLAINASLKPDSMSRTSLFLGYLVTGMREAGAEVEIVNLREKEIKNCIGCFSCMTITPERCILKDAMTNDIFPKWLEADVVIYAAPIMAHTINVAMKNFIERTCGILGATIIKNEDRWGHPYRRTPPAIVALSVAGLPTMASFENASHYYRSMYPEHEGRLLAEIYRSDAELCTGHKRKHAAIAEALRQAGQQLVTERRVFPETLACIQQTVFDTPEESAEVANCMWRGCLEEGILRQKYESKQLMPRPDTVRAYMNLMSMGFNPAVSKGVHAVYQFIFTGEIEGACSFHLNDGAFKAAIGMVENADITVTAPFDVWMNVITGVTEGGAALMQGLYKAEGDINLLITMGHFFN